MKPKNLVYFGSPAFSAEILASLLPTGSDPAASLLGGWPNGLPRGMMPIKVVGIVTGPDKPVGRKHILTPSTVAAAAAKYDLPVFKPAKLDDAHLAHLKLLKPDIFLVISYGKIIPANYLTTPTIGTFNIHFSLLPQYRGALPISESLKNGDQETGVTLMLMDEQLDHGPVISQSKIGIDINDNCQTLTTKLTQIAKKLLAGNLPRLAENNYTAIPQDETLATYTPKTRDRNRQAAFISFNQISAALNSQDALSVHNLIRSVNPEPGAWTKIDDHELKIIKTTVSNGQLLLKQVQLPGKSPVSWTNFLNGHIKTPPPE